MSQTASRKALNIENINQNVRIAEYAVRGELATKSEQYRTQLEQQQQQQQKQHDRQSDRGDSEEAKNDATALPFDTVISANIGNPQQLDQKPITFFRQVLSILENPELLANETALQDSFGYKLDVIDRARWLLQQVKSVGAYSQSQGAAGIRQSVADYIERRDGHPANKDEIFLSAGASSGVNTLMNIICAKPESGVMVPIPQYPLYTATLAVLGARCVPYYLDEASAWGTDMGAIESAYETARGQGTDIRAIAIINPGNPTGACLPEESIRAVVDFAAKKHLVILADEVYQTNVFIGQFTSFRKVLRNLQQEHRNGQYDDVELVSFNSISKGMVGECGHRGGYFEAIGFDPQVVAQIYKFVSIVLCPPVIGQCLVEMQVNPPKEGDPSYPQYREEYDSIKQGLQDRATALYDAFKDMEGVDCQEPQGAMYLFPTISLPPKAIAAAKADGRSSDAFYCMRLLDATGICVVPGSGFGQKEGTLHFRTTFLAPGTEWVGRIQKFHKAFCDEFR